MIEEKRLKKFFSKMPKNFLLPKAAVESKLLKEYGAMFVARNGAIPPNAVIFKNEEEVKNWQMQIPQAAEYIGGFKIELQVFPMKSLLCAIDEAKSVNMTITPRNADSAKRTYKETIELWNSRVTPGLEHWIKQDKLSFSEAAKIRALPLYEQISEIFRLEEQGIYFSKSLDKSIIYSVAPPGTSQHISMLALDIIEFENAGVREILANYGWFQTVISDLPHFTYLGAKESELPALGLKKITDGGRVYWIPDI